MRRSTTPSPHLSVTVADPLSTVPGRLVGWPTATRAGDTLPGGPHEAADAAATCPAGKTAQTIVSNHAQRAQRIAIASVSVPTWRVQHPSAALAGQGGIAPVPSRTCRRPMNL